MPSWTKDEDRLLRRFYGADGVSIEDIAECLERDVPVIEARLRALRLLRKPKRAREPSTRGPALGQRWGKREDELARVWLMTLDDLAHHLGCTDIDVLKRLREIGALQKPAPAEEILPALAKNTARRVPSLAQLVPQNERGDEAMDAEPAEKVARRVMLHLYRGSIDAARKALNDGWHEHVGEQQPLPTGDELLAVSLAEVLKDSAAKKSDQGFCQRLLNQLDSAGIFTVGDLLRTSDAELLAIPNVGEAAFTRLHNLAVTMRLRAFGDTGATVRTSVRGRQPKAVGQLDPQLRKFCEEETLRLLPLIEMLARKSKIPLPLEDLVQEGAMAVYKALPRFDPNRQVKVETWVAPRIVGSFADYARKMGRLLAGGQRTGRTEAVVSLDDVVYENESRDAHLKELITSADTVAEHCRRGGEVWSALLRGFSDRERLMTLQYFVLGHTMREIAEGFGVSESRVSQQVSSILTRLRDLDANDGRLQELCA